MDGLGGDLPAFFVFDDCERRSLSVRRNFLSVGKRDDFSPERFADDERGIRVYEANALDGVLRTGFALIDILERLVPHPFVFFARSLRYPVAEAVNKLEILGFERRDSFPVQRAIGGVPFAYQLADFLLVVCCLCLTETYDAKPQYKSQ